MAYDNFKSEWFKYAGTWICHVTSGGFHLFNPKIAGKRIISKGKSIKIKEKPVGVCDNIFKFFNIAISLRHINFTLESPRHPLSVLVDYVFVGILFYFILFGYMYGQEKGKKRRFD